MTTQRKIEIFSAGCPVCEETVELVNQIACASCQVSVLDMMDPNVAGRAKNLGIRSVPAVVIDGKLADCCARRGPDETTLRASGLGRPPPSRPSCPPWETSSSGPISGRSGSPRQAS